MYPAAHQQDISRTSGGHVMRATQRTDAEHTEYRTGLADGYFIPSSGTLVMGMTGGSSV
ncbi:hypothetical protein DSM19430T_04180 [Desulfovibrio psychrotolerans]|uniref:Uncharacterized protein n=1 Tax=Desulfovibrio psychrotolerans TaxID=415242 RepID=A0A7J0BRT6_9BACT|nr:hypothetical protein DSM19430T_04180 [Desulfovibrio psychrotolerans]